MNGKIGIEGRVIFFGGFVLARGARFTGARRRG